LFAAAGYGVVRYYNEMHRPLNQELPEAVLDPGLELVTFGPALHEPVRLAHYAAFRDHWGTRKHGALSLMIRRPGRTSAPSCSNVPPEP
jgi:hypothetical protein